MDAPAQRTALLRGIPFFRSLAAKTMFELGRRARERIHSAGEILVEAGAWEDSLAIVVRGRAAITVAGNPVREVGSGEYFSRAVPLEGFPPGADLVARDETVLLVIEPRDLEQLMRIPDVARGVIDLLTSRADHGIATSAGAEPVPPERPSIAVLPFANMSDDPEQEYFSDGLTEDLITDLAKLSGVLVIARNSVFAYKGQAVDIQQVGRELGVRTVLEGSVRRSGDRMRITAQLIDTGSGGHLWAERYDREVDDIFAVQDEVTSSIVAALSIQLNDAERGLITRRETEDPEAYDHVLRGAELLHRITKEGNSEARREFERAIEIDPDYALAYAKRGVTSHLDWVLAYTDDPGAVEAALSDAEHALELDDTLSEAHLLLGLVHMMQDRPREAINELERAVALSPNDPTAWYTLASVCNMAGDPTRAFGLIERAMRLNPRYPFEYPFEVGHSYYLTGELEKAVASLTRALTLNPDFHPAHFFLTAAYVELGLEAEAAGHLRELEKTWEHPSLSHFRARMRYSDPAVIERIMSALRAVGVPD